MNTSGRRSRLLLLGVAVTMVAATSLLGCGSSGSRDATDLTGLSVSVGRQPFAAGNSPITQYMRDNQLFEKAAEEAGYDLEVEYRDYPSAAPQVEAMIGGRLDIGMWGNTPVIRALAQKQPISVIGVGEGNMRFVLATRAGSGITNVADLKGKKVGLLLGGDPQLAFLGMLKGELGNGDPRAHDIDLVSLPTQAIAATVPKGVDATVVIHPALLKQRADGDDVVGILNSHGFTEAGYDGPAGKGAGKPLPSAAESAFAPEGFYGHRSFWVARDELLEEHPKVITAFLVAEQRALEALAEQSPEKVSESVEKYWKLAPVDGAEVLDDEILFRRGFVWATESDAVVIKKLSDLMAANDIIPSELRWGDVTAGFTKAGKATRAAYEAVGEKPGASGFDAVEADARGPAQWQLSEWREPK